MGLEKHSNYGGGGRARRAQITEPAWWQQIRDGGCSYDLGDERGFNFCGEPVRKGSSFCAKHHALCWIPQAKARELAT